MLQTISPKSLSSMVDTGNVTRSFLSCPVPMIYGFFHPRSQQLELIIAKGKADVIFKTWLDSGCYRGDEIQKLPLRTVRSVASDLQIVPTNNILF